MRVCAPRDQPRGARRVRKEGWPPRGARAGHVPGSGPARRPRPPGCSGGGGGAGRGDSAGGEERGAGAGRHRRRCHLRGRHQGRAARAASRAFLVYATCPRCTSRLQRPGRDAGARRAAGIRRGAVYLASSTSARPCTKHCPSLGLSFPVGVGAEIWTLPRQLLGGAAPRSRLPTPRARLGTVCTAHHLSACSKGRSPWVWRAGPDRPPCGL